MTRKRLFGLCLLVCFLCGVSAGPAMGEVVAAPGWAVSGSAEPTYLPPGSDGELALWVLNTGAVEGTGTLTVTLPAGMTATGEANVSHPDGPKSCTGIGTRVLQCEITISPAATSAWNEARQVPIHVSRETEGEEVVQVSMTGGGAARPATATIAVPISNKLPAPGFASLNMWLSNADGTTDTQAGSHPLEMTTTFNVNSEPGVGGPGYNRPVSGGLRNLVVKLPPGIIGAAYTIPACTLTELGSEFQGEGEEEGGCPADTQVGVMQVTIEGAIHAELPIFNMVPPPGVPAQFGVSLSAIQQLMNVSLRSGGNYGLSLRLNNLVETDQVTSVSATFWGDPGSSVYNGDRAGCLQASGCSTPAARPLLTLPTSCGAPPQFSMEVLGTWDDPRAYSRSSVAMHNSEGVPVGVTGCEQLLHFNPGFLLAPETTRADSGTGLSTVVSLPQEVNGEGLATSAIRDATVVLPEGMVINPGQASGLVACQQGVGQGTDDLPLAGEDGETEAFSGPPQCPASSKIGETEISTPTLPDRLKGSIYVLQSNPPEVKILVSASGDGVNVKLPATVHLNEATGRLTTTFEGTPDTPVNEFKLIFEGGPHAALVTPSACRVYSGQASFVPWSGLESALSEERFTITSGPEGTPCASPLPFSPTLSAGSGNVVAGGYTSFSMLLGRGDGQQRVSRLQFKTPAGRLGELSHVTPCPEPQASKGECSSASEIGHTVVESGPGSNPLVLPEAGQPQAPIYLTGGYEGAPYGLTIVMPVVAGPFTLPTQVIRGKIEVDRRTSQLAITTDSLPTIIAGVPTDLRSIYAVIDRPGFMFNPTSCTATSLTGAATSTEGATAALSSRFQVGACPGLAFAPSFDVSSSAHTSKTQGASLDVKLAPPHQGPQAGNSEEANITKVKVEIPKILPSRLTTLQTACTVQQFDANPAGCPSASVVGTATVRTPVLNNPLTGPAYFVSHAGEAFPQLIILLQGDGITVALVGDTFISKTTGITSSTFAFVPDVPVSSFELNLPQGPYSVFAAPEGLCKQALTMPTEFVAQNGIVLHQSTPINVEGCPGSLSFSSSVKKRTAKLTVYAPAAGKLTASVKGLTTASKTAKGHETITITLKQKKAGKLKTTIKLTLTPTTGKKQTKTHKLTLKK